MKKIFVIVARGSYGSDTQLIRAFESEAEANDTVALIESCEPRLTLKVVEIDLKSSALLSTVVEVSPGWKPNSPPGWGPNSAPSWAPTKMTTGWSVIG